MGLSLEQRSVMMEMLIMEMVVPQSVLLNLLINVMVLPQVYVGNVVTGKLTFPPETKNATIKTTLTMMVVQPVAL